MAKSVGFWACLAGPVAPDSSQFGAEVPFLITTPLVEFIGPTKKVTARPRSHLEIVDPTAIMWE